MDPSLPPAAPAAAPAVLLLGAEPWSRRMAALCHDAAPSVSCMQHSDPLGKMFDAGIGQVLRLVVEAARGRAFGPALAAHWRRLAPQARVLDLSVADSPEGEQLRRELSRLPARTAPTAAAAASLRSRKLP